MNSARKEPKGGRNRNKSRELQARSKRRTFDYFKRLQARQPQPISKRASGVLDETDRAEP
jgi:hypothetical protein